MARARVNGIDLEYEVFGGASAPTLLLISGAGAQMIQWHEHFCEGLAAHGFRVIRFDNRDVGLSTSFADRPDQSYSLDDLASDAAGLLDALGIAAAHIVGTSMGGYVAQLVAINHPEKVLSLTSVASSAGGEDMSRGTAEDNAFFSEPLPTDSAARIEHRLKRAKVLNAEYFDEAFARSQFERSQERAPDLFGTRQRTAILAAPSRASRLGQVRVPVLVIHGDQDRMLVLDNGVRTAAAVLGCTFIVIPGMGHALSPALWPRLITAIASHASAVQDLH